MHQDIQYENAEIHDFRVDLSPGIFFQCDHASNQLPHGYSWTQSDQLLFADSHWAVDHGALKLAQALAAQTKSILVNTKYSRLFCDVNRQLQAETLCREHGDGQAIELNQNLGHSELLIRARYHSSYQLALRDTLRKTKPTAIYSIHSFTPVYEGKRRQVEVGILTSLFDQFGEQHLQTIREEGFDCRLNEPYTGKNGLNYSLDNSCLAFAQPIKGTLFEVRSDLLVQRFDDVVSALAKAIVRNQQ